MNYAHVTTQRILNKFIETNFSVGYGLFQDGLPLKILMRLQVLYKKSTSLVHVGGMAGLIWMPRSFLKNHSDTYETPC